MGAFLSKIKLTESWSKIKKVTLWPRSCIFSIFWTIFVPVSIFRKRRKFINFASFHCVMKFFYFANNSFSTNSIFFVQFDQYSMHGSIFWTTETIWISIELDAFGPWLTDYERNNLRITSNDVLCLRSSYLIQHDVFWRWYISFASFAKTKTYC